jgi:hypothetical protein
LGDQCSSAMVAVMMRDQDGVQVARMKVKQIETPF